MHPSRMHTVRCSSHLAGGGCLPKWGCLPGRGGGVCLVGEGGICPGGCLPDTGWWCTPPPCGQTDTCENITFPQLLLRTVKKQPDELM